MTQRKHTPSYTAEFRARGVRLFNEQRSEYRSDNAAYQAIAPKLGCAPDSLRGWCRQSERDAGARNGPTSEPPRVYRRVKLSKDEPYDTTQTYPVLYG